MEPRLLDWVLQGRPSWWNLSAQGKRRKGSPKWRNLGGLKAGRGSSWRGSPPWWNPGSWSRLRGGQPLGLEPRMPVRGVVVGALKLFGMQVPDGWVILVGCWLGLVGKWRCKVVPATLSIFRAGSVFCHVSG